MSRASQQDVAGIHLNDAEASRNEADVYLLQKAILRVGEGDGDRLIAKRAVGVHKVGTHASQIDRVLALNEYSLIVNPGRQRIQIDDRCIIIDQLRDNGYEDFVATEESITGLNYETKYIGAWFVGIVAKEQATQQNIICLSTADTRYCDILPTTVGNAEIRGGLVDDGDCSVIWRKGDPVSHS